MAHFQNNQDSSCSSASALICQHMEPVGGLKITICTLKFLSPEKHILILVVAGLYVVKASVNVHSIRLTKKKATMICKKEIKKSYFESMMFWLPRKRPHIFAL